MDIVVTWDKMGSEFSYGVWWARNPVGPWFRDNDIRLTDDIIDKLRGLSVDGSYGPSAETNVYTITDLDAQTKYSIKVTCDDRYDAWWYSYNGYEDLTGGLAAPHTRPVSNGGNVLGFQFQVIIP